MAKPTKIGKRWKIQVRRKGVNKYATFDTKNEAVAWAKETERQILGGASEYSKGTTFQTACNKYLNEVATHKKGWRWEKVRINKFLNDGLGNHSLFSMPSKFWKQWIANRLNQVSNSSVNRELNLISAIFEHMKELELTEVNPIRGIKRPRTPKHRDRLVSDDEIDLIISELSTDPNKSKGQTGIAFLMAIETGMRRGELLSMKRNDISLDDRVATVIESKNGDKRDVPLSTKAVELFEVLGGELFTVSAATLSTLFRRACINIGIEDLKFHDSRHAAVTRLSKKLSLLELARMIGHRDPRSLMIYYNESASEIAKRLD